jgi:DNA-binding transcriptional LysR family regulator
MIGHQIEALEELLEMPLFRRLTGAQRLTDAGQAVLPTLAGSIGFASSRGGMSRPRPRIRGLMGFTRGGKRSNPIGFKSNMVHLPLG